MWLYTVTFSNSLSAGPRQRWLPVARHRFPAEKVPVKSLFRRHLLEFVISRPASEASLAALCKIPVWKVPGETAFLHHLVLS